jgi:uncharacterized protein YbaP (TraB family)
MRKILITTMLVLFSVSSQAQILYKISGKGLKEASYIVGTFHTVKATFVDSIPGARRVMDECQQTYGELRMQDMFIPDTMQIVQNAQLLPEGTTIDKVLSADEMTRLNAYMKKILGMDFTNSAVAEQMGRFSPEAINMQLSMALYFKKEKGFDPNNLIDSYFQKQALAQGKNVGGLETYSFQAKTIFQGKTLERQKEGLMCMVDNPDFTDEMVATVTKAYYAQDLDAIKDAIDTKMHNSCDATPEEEARIIFDRNADWLTKMPAIMEQKSTLFAVGAGHLIGDKGVLNLLRQAGYTVEAVTE